MGGSGRLHICPLAISPHTCQSIFDQLVHVHGDEDEGLSNHRLLPCEGPLTMTVAAIHRWSNSNLVAKFLEIKTTYNFGWFKFLASVDFWVNSGH